MAWFILSSCCYPLKHVQLVGLLGEEGIFQGVGGWAVRARSIDPIPE